MTRGLSRRPLAVPVRVVAMLAVGLAGSLVACSSGTDIAGPVQTTPLLVTVSPEFIAPSEIPSSSIPVSLAPTPAPSTESVAASQPAGPGNQASSMVTSPGESSQSVPDLTPVATFDLVLRDNPSPQEAADRVAIEAQWRQFWKISLDLTPFPQSDWEQVLATVAVDPIKSGVLQTAAKRELTGVKNYGDPVHKIFWQLPVNGSDAATIADCQDQSSAGTIDTATGVKSSPGGSEVNLRGSFVRGADGVWRLSRVVELGGIACPSL